MAAFTKQHISFVEYGVFNYPKELKGWRRYRIEYGGHAEECICECTIWLPPFVDVRELEDAWNKQQGYTGWTRL